MDRLITWFQGLFTPASESPRSPKHDELTDEQTVNMIRARLERQARRIAILDAQVDAQRGARR